VRSSFDGEIDEERYRLAGVHLEGRAIDPDVGRSENLEREGHGGRAYPIHYA
jgi:hypothetical protein